MVWLEVCFKQIAVAFRCDERDICMSPEYYSLQIINGHERKCPSDMLPNKHYVISTLYESTSVLTFEKRYKLIIVLLGDTHHFKPVFS